MRPQLPHCYDGGNIMQADAQIPSQVLQNSAAAKPKRKLHMSCWGQEMALGGQHAQMCWPERKLHMSCRDRKWHWEVACTGALA